MLDQMYMELKQEQNIILIKMYQNLSNSGRMHI